MDNHMRKVAIITRHSVPNYGSFLQALATQRMIEELSLIPTIIDYRRHDESPSALINQYCHDHKNPLYSLYYNTFWRYSHSKIEKVLERERRKYLKCSERVYVDSLSNIYGKYDLYLTGSDQVWNVVGSGKTKEIDGAYFWDGLSEDSKVISYSASFGDSDLRADDYNRCKNWLRKYDYISVREDTGVKLLNRMGYRAEQVLDPTMVIEKDFWEKLCQKSTLRLKNQFVLVYNLHSNSNMKQFLMEEFKNSGFDVVSITTTFRKGLGKNIFCPEIADFLWLFKNASCVYADSFHAIAFSIIFNTPFVSTLPKEYSTRLESILRLFHLNNCIADVISEKGWKEGRINWAYVNSVLEQEKDKSIKWLSDSVKSLYL